jgi:hypothetical protein
MDPITEAAAGGSEPAPVSIVRADGDGKLSVAQAARALASARHKSRDQEQALEPRQALAPVLATTGSAEVRAVAAEPGQEFSPAAVAASEQAGERDPRLSPAYAGTSRDDVFPGEADGADPAAPDPRLEAGAELPPIEPPRSWTKADKDLFTSLPRETQERIAERERLREGDFLRRQAEAAEKLKGLGAKEQAVDQARQQYEAALPQLLFTLHDHQDLGGCRAHGA